MDAEPQDKIPRIGEDKLVRRAAAAYLVDPLKGRWPDELESIIERHDKLNYVVLRDRKGKRLAAYRLRHEAGDRPAQLKRLVRYPDGMKP